MIQRKTYNNKEMNTKEEDTLTIFINIYAPNIRAPEYIN